MLLNVQIVESGSFKNEIYKQKQTILMKTLSNKKVLIITLIVSVVLLFSCGIISYIANNVEKKEIVEKEKKEKIERQEQEKKFQEEKRVAYKDIN